MSRINLKKPTAVFLSILLVMQQMIPAVGAENNRDDNELYFAAYDNEIVENVQTGTVTKGEFIVKDVCRASIVYENVSYVFNEISTGNVVFEGMLVSDGDFVNAGDPIAEVSLSVNVETVDELAASIDAETEAKGTEWAWIWIALGIVIVVSLTVYGSVKYVKAHPSEK